MFLMLMLAGALTGDTHKHTSYMYMHKHTFEPDHVTRRSQLKLHELRCGFRHSIANYAEKPKTVNITSSDAHKYDRSRRYQSGTSGAARHKCATYVRTYDAPFRADLSSTERYEPQLSAKI